MSHPTNIGQILTTREDRDAILVAIAPVVAGEPLKAGQHVRVHHNNIAVGNGETIGVIDPFLREDVKAGEQCWLFLYPGSIKSLRHDWIHPSFFEPVNQPDFAAALRTIRENADSLGVSPDELLVSAREYLTSGKSISSDHGGNFKNRAEFWAAYCVLTGTSESAIDDAYNAHDDPFSCSSC